MVTNDAATAYALKSLLVRPPPPLPFRSKSPPSASPPSSVSSPSSSLEASSPPSPSASTARTRTPRPSPSSSLVRSPSPRFSLYDLWWSIHAVGRRCRCRSHLQRPSSSSPCPSQACPRCCRSSPTSPSPQASDHQVHLELQLRQAQQWERSRVQHVRSVHDRCSSGQQAVCCSQPHSLSWSHFCLLGWSLFSFLCMLSYFWVDGGVGS